MLLPRQVGCVLQVVGAMGGINIGGQGKQLTQQAGLGLRLISELEGIWSSLGYFKEGLNLLGQLLALPADIDPAHRANYLQNASDLAWQQHDFETAISYSKEAVDLGRQFGLKGRYSTFINRLGRIYIEQGRYAEAKQALQEGIELAHQEPESVKPGILLAQLGEIAFFESRFAEAKSILEDALSQQMGDDEAIFIAMAKTDLAETALAEGDFEKAREWLEQALPHASQHARRFVVFLSALAGYLALSPNGEKTKAAQLFGAVESLSEHSGVVLGSFYQNLNRKRMELVKAKLSAKEWLGAFESGVGWERGEAIQQAKGMVTKKSR